MRSIESVWSREGRTLAMVAFMFAAVLLLAGVLSVYVHRTDPDAWARTRCPGTDPEPRCYQAETERSAVSIIWPYALAGGGCAALGIAALVRGRRARGRLTRR